MKKYKRITKAERVQIKELYDEGYKIEQIAKALGRAPSGIRYELERGYTGHYYPDGRREYSAKLAQSKVNYISADDKADMLRKQKELDD